MDSKDKFGIFKYTKQIIDNHLQFEGSKTSQFGFPAELPKTCDDCKNPGSDIETRYKKAEREFVGYIEGAAKPIKNAYDIVHLFRDACFGLNMLGLRFDSVYEKTQGKPKASDMVLLSNSVRKDVTFGFSRIENDSDDLIDDIFNALPGEIIDGPLDKIDSLVITAMQGAKNFEYDSKTLLAVYLLQHLQKTNAKMDLGCLTCAFNLTSCANDIVRGNWKQRSVIGYFDADKSNEFGGEFINALNLDFVRIFTGKLDVLFLTGAPDDYATISLKNTLYDLATVAYFNYSNDALHAFQAVSDVIDMYSRNKTIAAEHIDGCDYRANIYRAIVLPRYDIESGETYELNIAGLQQFVALIDALNLSDMPGFTEIAARIRDL
jgi:hypothetical protein